MKKRIVSLVALTSLCVGAGYAFAQYDKDKKMSPEEQAQAAKMETWMKLAEPGEHHKHLDALAGTWKTTTKWWMVPGEPDISQGTCKNEWILGGRYLAMDFKSTSAEHPFAGFGLLGYDNIKKQHVNMWCDTMGTTIALSFGSSDESGKVFSYSATFDDPMTGQPVTKKMVTKVINENKHVFTIHNVGKDGNAQQELEVTYVRAG